MAEFFNYDPLTGITEYFDYDEEKGLAIIHSTQDVQPYIEKARAMRLSGIWKEKLKDDDYLLHHAELPNIVIMQLRNKGINIDDPNCTNDLLREIDQNYPYLKCTDMVHRVS
jgi:hypothetical protein